MFISTNFSKCIQKFTKYTKYIFYNKNFTLKLTHSVSKIKCFYLSLFFIFYYFKCPIMNLARNSMKHAKIQKKLNHSETLGHLVSRATCLLNPKNRDILCESEHLAHTLGLSLFTSFTFRESYEADTLLGA